MAQQVDLTLDELSDLYDALDEAIVAINAALALDEENGDYGPEDRTRMIAKRDRWYALADRVRYALR